MSKADVKAGRAYVELYLKNSLTRGLAAAGKQLSAFGSGAMGVGKSILGIGAGVASAGALMASAFAAPIMAAGDLMETTSKFGAVFGEQTGEATAWLDDFTKSVGRGKKEAMDGMAAFGAFFQGMGKGGQEAADMAKKMTTLAIDFGSFHNVSDPESIQRFISALSGSSQVLDMFGVNIKQSALDMKLLEMGFPSVAKGADETQKVMARMAIIEESMGRQGALGDAVRTAGSFSNQMKKLRGTIMDGAAAIGNALLPVVTPLITKGAELTTIFAAWVKDNQEVIRTVAKLAVGITAAGGAIAALGALIFGVGAVFSSVGAIITGIGVTLGIALLSPLGLLATALVAGGAAWLKWTDNGKKAVGTFKGIFGNLVETFKDTWGGVADAFAAGDMKLAAQIAFAGLKVAALDTFETIRTAFKPLVDTVMGLWDIATTFFGVAVDGIKAAWTAFTGFFTGSVGETGGSWADFAEGLVNVFTDAAKAVADVWQGMVTGLAKLFLEQTWLTDVDVEREQAARMLAQQEGIATAERHKTHADDTLKRFKSGERLSSEDLRGLITGDTMRALFEGRATGQQVLADLEATAADAQAKLDNLRGESTDLRGQAFSNIEDSVGGAADSFRRKMDDLARRAEQRGEPDDLFRPPTAAERAREEMDRLKRQAAKAKADSDARREEAKNKGAAVGAAAENAVKGATSSGSQFGSFSAAALGAVGAGGVAQRQLAEIRRQREELAKQAAEQKKRDDALKAAVQENRLQVVA